jgi:hypothetical protein
VIVSFLDPDASDLPGPARDRLRDELATLRAQRDLLKEAGAEDARASDSGDRAEALRRAGDMFRIREINRLLTAGRATPVATSKSVALLEGHTITLRFCACR